MKKDEKPKGQKKGSGKVSGGRKTGTDVFRWGNKTLDRDEQHRMRREILLRTAAQAFNETSYHTTTLDDLAKRLNVTKPTLYYYIKDKDDILFECQRMAFGMIKDVLEDPTSTQLTGIEQLANFLSRYTELITNEFGTCLVRTGLRPLKPESREKLLQFARQIDTALRKIVKSGIADGTIRDVDPRLAANAVFGGFNGICQWYNPDDSISKEQISSSFIDIFVSALASSKNG